MWEEILGETLDPWAARVVLPDHIWSHKVLRDHPELAGQRDAVLRAVGKPDHVETDPVFDDRRRFFLRDAGPTRWLVVVVSYEQEPARIISAFGIRKDPRSWTA